MAQGRTATIPDFQTLMRPVLAYLADGETRRTRDVKDAMTDAFELSDEERARTLPSGRQRTIDNRVGWALTYLRQAGLVDVPSRGRVVINEALPNQGCRCRLNLPASRRLRVM